MRVTKRHRVHRKSGHAAAQNFQFGLPQTDGQGTKIGAPIGGSARVLQNFSITQCDAGIRPVVNGPGQPEREGARLGGVRTSVQGRPGAFGGTVTRHNSRN